MKGMKRLFNSTIESPSPAAKSQESDGRKKMNIKYSKLVVPTRMRSVWWKFFGFPANEAKEIITKEIIVCVLCRTQMIYNRNTSNLRTHLRCRHKDVCSKFESLDESDPQCVSAVEKLRTEYGINDSFEFSTHDILETTGQSSYKSNGTKEVPTVVLSEGGSDADISNVSIIFPNNDIISYSQSKGDTDETIESTEMSEAVVNFIISDLISPDIVDGNGFHRLMSNTSSKTVIIPYEKKILNDIIPNIYVRAKERIQEAIISGCITNLSLSIEEWTSSHDVNCLSVYAHYLQNGNPVLTTRLLGTVSCSDIETSDQWGEVIEKLLTEWSINLSAVSAILVAFLLPELKSFLDSKDVIQLPCFMYVIEEICSKFIFQLPTVANLLKKCRSLMKLVLRKQIGQDADSELQENYDEYTSDIFGFDKTGLWVTTYYMLYGLKLRRNNILADSVVSSSSPLNNTDWKNLNDLVDFLEPLKTIITTFFEEKCPIVSLLNPLIWKVMNNCEVDEEDSTFIAEVKELLKNRLDEAYTESKVYEFIQMATLLDPRFKSFVKQNVEYDVKKELHEALTLLINTEGFLSIDQVQETTAPAAKKLNRSSGMNMLFSKFQVKKQAVTLEDKISNEITCFEYEKSAILEECPLEWWQHMQTKCPNLIKLARKYFCVPAMVFVNGNHSILDRLRFHHKRAALRLEIVDMLLFLNLNRDL